MYIYIILTIATFFIIYVVIDNKRLKIRNKLIVCGNKGKSIKVLQISDLHSKVLTNSDYVKINSLDYDVIAFTGDTFVNKDKEYRAIIDFMKNVRNVKNVLYVDGNNGTKAYSKIDNTLTSLGKKLQSMGIIVIKDTYTIKDVIFTNYNVITSKILDNEKHGKYKIYDDLNNSMRNVNDDNIGLTHYPLDRTAIEILNNTKQYYVPDLIIAGHLHGGQFRIPFFGAIVIPNVRTAKLTLFPNQKLVMGLYQKGKVRQYISRGVGATNNVKFCAFRLFNTPEIDLLEIQF